MRGGAEHEPPGAIVLWFGANWKPLPGHKQAASQPLNHNAAPTAVITTVCSLLIIVFLQEPKPRVKCFLSAHLQVLQNNYQDMQSLAYNGEISQKHIHIVIFFFSPHSLEIQLYYELNSTLGEMCVINVWMILQRNSQHFTTSSSSRCPADVLTEILPPRCSHQSARWYFINANDKDLITPASLVDKESLKDGGWPSGSHQEGSQCRAAEITV